MAPKKKGFGGPLSKLPQPKPGFFPPQPKWGAPGRPMPSDSAMPPHGSLQQHGGPVWARLQDRLEDPEWLNTLADQSDGRELLHRSQGGDDKRRKLNPAVPIPGLPPPPASALGSRQKMQAHHQTYSPEHRRAANFVPASKSVILCGRAVQLLMITHEQAEHNERDPYIPWLFRPLVPHCLLGYTADAKHSPKGPKHFCVIRWFQVNNLFLLQEE